ncbi:MAG TPA: hypothetical protein VN776_13120 [Terracidiphilus sp.]|nr:hypothetical protein [Terracidiphilus sp.]
MKALSSAELKIEDLGGELQFTISREPGWVEVVLETGVLSGVGVYALLQQSVLFLCGCVLGIGALLINWAQGSTTVFRISNRGVIATGNLHRWSSSDVSIPASEVRSIGWSSGSCSSDGGSLPDGIYVWHRRSGLKSTCVLPGLSHKKAQAVTDAIKARFPQFTIERGP